MCEGIKNYIMFYGVVLQHETMRLAMIVIPAEELPLNSCNPFSIVYMNRKFLQFQTLVLLY